MTENIGTQIVNALASIIPIYLAEAETEEYPYAVYNMTVVPYFNKDGVYRFRAEVSIDIYDKDFNNADAKTDLIVTALDGLASPYFPSLRSRTKDCTDGVWDITLNYIINQMQQ